MGLTNYTKTTYEKNTLFGILGAFGRIGLHEFSFNLPDKRLNVRYAELVKSHMKQSTVTATGIAVPADLKSSFATTQALALRLPKLQP